MMDCGHGLTIVIAANKDIQKWEVSFGGLHFTRKSKIGMNRIEGSKEFIRIINRTHENKSIINITLISHSHILNGIIQGGILKITNKNVI